MSFSKLQNLLKAQYFGTIAQACGITTLWKKSIAFTMATFFLGAPLAQNPISKSEFQIITRKLYLGRFAIHIHGPACSRWPPQHNTQRPPLRVNMDNAGVLRISGRWKATTTGLLVRRRQQPGRQKHIDVLSGRHITHWQQQQGLSLVINACKQQQ